MRKNHTIPDIQNCLRCGRCTDVCPSFLQPLFISAYSLKDDYDTVEYHRAMDCIECGSCSIYLSSKKTITSIYKISKRNRSKEKKASCSEIKKVKGKNDGK